ncbi:MAG: alpha/beta hydrolase [Eubacteriales bacterium]
MGEFAEITLPQTGEDEESEVVRIHYLEAGVGEPLLLIHSLGQSLYTWRNVFAELSDNYRVIAIDLPGHGYSSRPDTFSYTADDFAFVFNAFLDALNIKSVHVLGFSIGAMYMLRFLSLYPKRVANCVAISPGGITEHMPSLIHNMQKPLIATFARNLYTANDVRKLLSECYADPSMADDFVVKQYYEPISDGLTREALMYALRNYDQERIAEGLLPVEHEVLVLWGKNDVWHPPSGSVYFQSILRAGRYYLIRNAGHLLHEEAPVKLLEILYSYIPPAVPSYDVYRYTQNLTDDME